MRKIICAAIVLSILLPFASYARNPEYNKARKCYYDEAKPKGSNSRVWDKCIKLFEKSAKGIDEEAGIYSAARLRREAFYRFSREKDRDEAIRLYNDIIKKYPAGTLAPDSLYRIGTLRQDAFKDKAKAKKAYLYLIEHYPNSSVVPMAKKRLESLKSKKTSKITSKAKKKDKNVTWANPRDLATLSWERMDENGNVVIRFIADKKTRYTFYKIPTGKRTKSPAELVVQFPHTKLYSGLSKKVPLESRWTSKLKVHDNFFSRKITAKFYLKKGAKFSVKHSGADVIVTIGKFGASTIATKSAGKTMKERSKKARPLRVMIDPGHGGKDSGAMGPKGTKEKDVVLAVAKQLRWFLRKRMKAKVKLTRTKDKYLTLDERNRMAEKWNADVFISLHVNASPNKDRRGVETYYLNNTTNRASIKLARQENKYSGRSLKDIERIVLTMLQNYNAEESKDLSKNVQRGLVGQLSKNYGKVEDRGVKNALFYVLVGARCPGILVEMSFISNPAEEKRLKLKHYQSNIALGITKGIEKFLKKHPPE